MTKDRKRDQRFFKRKHTVAVVVIMSSFFSVLFISLLIFGYEMRSATSSITYQQKTVPAQQLTQKETTSFPIGVDPINKTIRENPLVNNFFAEHIAVNVPLLNFHIGWFDRLLGKLAMISWYQNFASLSSRLLVIQSGERKEEIASNFADILGWNNAEKLAFMATVTEADPTLGEGTFYPGKYTVARDATPTDVAPLILNKFDTEIRTHYGNDLESIVPLNTTLTIASLLEREAYDFDDMRSVSGVIWNRLFAGMKLQIDATLQYAKADLPNEPSWWPKVKPEDKYIPSPFNTYQNEGLPPTPIANPSIDAILAAINPHKTDCMYYFHDAHGEFHCSNTYQEHVALLRQYYGQGK